MIVADSFYTIGTTHQECQDYAMSNVIDDKAFAILADGCSSAPHSDWGARLLPQSLSRHIFHGCGIGEKFRTAAHMAEAQSAILGLPNTALRATLLSVSYISAAESIDANVYGDGYIVARRKDKPVIEVTKLEFSTGAPYYIAYELEPGGREAYKSQFSDGTFTAAKEMFEYSVDKERKLHLTSKGVFNQSFPIEECLCGGPLQDPIITTGCFPRDTYDFVAVVSDGLGQFVTNKREGTSAINSPVSTLAVLEELLAFNSYAPGFIKRRCQRAFKTFQDRGWANRDDFSIAGIYVG